MEWIRTIKVLNFEKLLNGVIFASYVSVAWRELKRAIIYLQSAFW